MAIAGRMLSMAVAAGVTLLATVAVLVPRPAAAQGYLNGYWAPLYDEDEPERIPGPDQGYYAGLPVTRAAASVAVTWDPERLTEPSLQCRPHPSIYGFRGVGTLRIWEVRDPYTEAQTQVQTWIAWQAQHRYIWMPASHMKHPPPWAMHTWQGFSVGHWVGDVLHVHTDMLKAAWTRRNGLPTDDKASMDERFFRYGNVLTHIMMISDRQYLAQPLVKSNEFQLIPNGTMTPYPCEQTDEIPMATGTVPMHLPDRYDTVQEWAARHHVPLQAAMGGPATELPQYQDTMKHLPAPPPMSVIEAREKALINRTEGE